MNQILGYLEKATDGIGRYTAVQKLLVVFLAVLLFAWLAEKKEISRNQNRFLVYSLFLTVVLLVPFTAVAVLIYQTAFYDYEWAWSMVPVTAVIAFGIVLFLEQEMSQKKKGASVIVMLCILCLCGNQGMIQKVPEKEVRIRREMDTLLEGIYSMSDSHEIVLWGPSEIMQGLRRIDGNIKLVYGRDMWDEKAAAYDYEAYSKELTDAYVWLEEAIVHYDTAVDSEYSQETLLFLEEQYGWSEDAGKHVEEAILAGTNTIVLPGMIGNYLEESLKEAVAAQDKEIECVFVGEYSIYRID